MATIEKRGDGYRVRWRDPDGAKSRQCPSLSVARAFVRDVEAAVALGNRWEPAVSAGAPEIGEVMADYLRRIARTKSLHTVMNRRSQLENFRRWLSGREKGRRLHPDLLSRRVLEEWDASMIADGRATSSRAQSINIVTAFWRWAYDDEEHGHHFPRPRKIETPARVAKPVRAPTWAQMDAAIAACVHEPARRTLVLMRCLGWRIGQVMRLRWDDVDMDARTVTLRGELGKSVSEKRGRTVPIAKALVAELAGWGLREGRLIQSNDFSDSAHTPQWQGTAAPVIFKHARDAWRTSGAPDEVWRQKTGHAFRRGFRSELKAAGIDSEAIEHYCDRTVGVRDLYTDPRSLSLSSLVDAIPSIGCVPGVSTLPRKRANNA